MDEEIKPRSWPDHVEIPKEFHSIDEVGEFKSCCMCEKQVQESMEPYLIERSFKRVNSSFENVLFEYAMCMGCAQKMNQALSKESLSNIEVYFKDKFGPSNSAERIKETSKNPMAWYTKCLVKSTPREELSEYNICGLFIGDRMLQGEFPYLLSIQAMEEVSALLSAKTKDELDDFRKTHLNGPPEFEELLKGRPVFIF